MGKWRNGRKGAEKKWLKDFWAQGSLQFHGHVLCCWILRSNTHYHKPSVKSAASKCLGVWMFHVKSSTGNFTDCLNSAGQDGREIRKFCKKMPESEISLRIHTPWNWSHFIRTLKGREQPHPTCGLHLHFCLPTRREAIWVQRLWFRFCRPSSLVLRFPHCLFYFSVSSSTLSSFWAAIQMFIISREISLLVHIWNLRSLFWVYCLHKYSMFFISNCEKHPKVPFPINSDFIVILCHLG